jgi:aerobic carbon-monoxide dehydrogenase large subunit
MLPSKFGVGQPHVRVEDPALLTGHGRFAADTIPADALHAFVVRSPHAHARFTLNNLDAVRAMPGVRLVLTGEDTKDLGPMPCAGIIKPSDEEHIWLPPFAVLCADTARFAGDAVAFIVADTQAQARDAAEAFDIDWDPQPAAPDLRKAAEAGSQLVWNERRGNVSFTAEVGDAKATEEAFKRAARTVKIEIVNQRIVANYMETRAVLAEPGNPVTLTLGSQGSHTIRNALVQKVLHIPKEELRVVTGDVGGGFGIKLGPYREYPLAYLAAKKLNKPVAWTGDRSEHFLGDSHGRDNITSAEVALDADNKFIGLRVDTIANMGAYLAYFAPFIVANGATMLPGTYDIPAMHARVRGIYTHTQPVDAYRGAGRPEATYVIERLVDAVAHEVGVSADEIRRINLIPQASMPYKTSTGRTYDSGDFSGHLDRALEAADWKNFTKRAKEAKQRGRIRGIGIACYIEACGGAGPEIARLRIEKDGSATLYIGTQTNGQGHATAYAQFVADELDLPLEKIRVKQGDTNDLPTGGGTGGSRSIPTGGPTTKAAAQKLAGQLKELASRELEAAPENLEIVDGAVRVTGSNRLVTFTALAQQDDPLLHAEGHFTPAAATYPNGTHICEVEIDPDTGETAIKGYWVVDDFGFTVNPLLLEGQIQGGVGQGVGQALMENTVFDESGQLLTASFMDYAIPHARDLADIRFETRNVPSTTHPLGIKGAGEAGTIGACPAVMNAVGDALHRNYGIKHIDMPATPSRIWRAIHREPR